MIDQRREEKKWNVSCCGKRGEEEQKRTKDLTYGPIAVVELPIDSVKHHEDRVVVGKER